MVLCLSFCCCGIVPKNCIIEFFTRPLTDNPLHFFVTLQISKEGDDFEVQIEVARMSELVKGMLEGKGGGCLLLVRHCFDRVHIFSSIIIPSPTHSHENNRGL